MGLSPFVIRRNFHIGTLSGDIVVIGAFGGGASEHFAQAAHITVSYAGKFGFDKCPALLDGRVCNFRCFKHRHFS